MNKGLAQYLVAVGGTLLVFGLVSGFFIGFYLRTIAETVSGIQIFVQALEQAGTFLSIIVVLIGGVGTVALSQVLQTYRTDIEAARLFRSQLKVLKSAFDDNHIENWSSEYTQEVIQALEQTYTNNHWLLPDEEHEEIMGLLECLHEIHSTSQGSGDTGRTNDCVQGVNKCKHLDEKIAYVTISGAALRYLGIERPYQNFESVS